MGILNFFKKKSSSDIAKDRLKILLISDHLIRFSFAAYRSPDRASDRPESCPHRLQEAPRSYVLPF